MRTYVTGSSPTHLGVRAWVAGTAEPDGWDLRAEDWTSALQGTGSWGMRAFLSSGAQSFPTVSFQSLLIKTRNPDAGVQARGTSRRSAPTTRRERPWRHFARSRPPSTPAFRATRWSSAAGPTAPFVVRVPGRASAPFTIEASAGDHPVVFGGTSTSTATIKITGTAAYVTVEGLKVQGTTGCIQLRRPRRVDLGSTDHVT